MADARFEAMDPSHPVDPEVLGLGGFVVRNAPYGMKLRCCVGIGPQIGTSKLQIVLVVPDRDTGHHVEVEVSDIVSDHQIKTVGAPELARRLIGKVVEHELHESTYVDGVRLRESHPAVEPVRAAGKTKP